MNVIKHVVNYADYTHIYIILLYSHEIPVIVGESPTLGAYACLAHGPGHPVPRVCVGTDGHNTSPNLGWCPQT